MGRARAFALATAAVVLLAPSAPTRPALQEGQPPPYVTTPPRVVERMLDMAGLAASDHLIDLGSGDGRIVRAAARRGARGLGIEMSPDLVELARQGARRDGVAARARFREGDALQADLSAATVLTLYLGPDLNERLVPRILDMMRPGSRVVSHDFGLGTWAPDATERFEVPEKNYGRGGESTVMLWIVPARVRGRWTLRVATPAAEAVAEVSLEQQFQQVEGSLRTREGWLPLVDIRLRGEELGFEVPQAGGPLAGRYRARVEGTRMDGMRTGNRGSAPVPFSAVRTDAAPDPDARR